MFCIKRSPNQAYYFPQNAAIGPEAMGVENAAIGIKNLAQIGPIAAF